MLPEERKQIICDYINQHQTATTVELMVHCNASEATIRRDLTELNKLGLITKVHGGAMALQNKVMSDYKVSERANLNQEEKIMIAKYAAELINDNDLVFIDAGTTTAGIIDYVTAKKVTFITNAISHALKISEKGYPVYLTGGLLKSTTEALVGAACYENLQRYNFSIGFFGTNGVTHKEGFTTPDVEEAKIKELALSRTQAPYVLCDHTKFHSTSPVVFAAYNKACIIATGNVPESYKADPTMIYI